MGSGSGTSWGKVFETVKKCGPRGLGAEFVCGFFFGRDILIYRSASVQVELSVLECVMSMVFYESVVFSTER